MVHRGPVARSSYTGSGVIAVALPAGLLVVVVEQLLSTVRPAVFAAPAGATCMSPLHMIPSKGGSTMITRAATVAHTSENHSVATTHLADKSINPI